MTELDPVWLLTCGSRGLLSVSKNDWLHHDVFSWFLAQFCLTSLSICLYLVSVGGIALTWTILVSIQELAAWSWKMTTTKPCLAHIRLEPGFVQGRLCFAWTHSADHLSRSTGSLLEAVLRCSSSCLQDVLRTCLIGSCRDMYSLFAKFCGAVGLQLFKALQDHPRWHWR